MQSAELIAYLDDYLAVRDVPDWKDAFNGLQVEGRPEVRRVAVAVDACLATIAQAVAGNADLMIVHHGLFWGAKAPVTGAYYRRLALLIKNGLALYSCHTPLDAHPEVGNNYVLARKLGLTPAGRFGEFEGVPLGVYAETEMTRDAFVARVREALGVSPLVMATGPETVRRVGIITGGAGSWIDRAAAQGLDTFLTGEGAHHTYFEAEERGLNVLYAGHYTTETVGVRALADHLRDRFGLETFYIDHPTGL
ncbi:MAG TPA: Nif3-like dinuclear metal center hexameric protein [Chthonomonadaceae bacterium]|nr:Nif3-like dinuclear metal center hexameric protein [Chthonomonadaceae bacterium]